MKRFVGWQALLTTGLVVFSGLAGAANVTWNVNAGNWDTVTANWTGDRTTYQDGDNVTFNTPSAASRIIVAAAVAPGSILINTTDTTKYFTLTNADITGACGLTQGGGGSVQFTGRKQWSFGGGVFSSNGTVIFDPPTLSANDLCHLGTNTIRLSGTSAAVQGKFRYTENTTVAGTGLDQDFAISGFGTLQTHHDNNPSSSLAFGKTVTLEGTGATTLLLEDYTGGGNAGYMVIASNGTLRLSGGASDTREIRLNAFGGNGSGFILGGAVTPDPGFTNRLALRNLTAKNLLVAANNAAYSNGFEVAGGAGAVAFASAESLGATDAGAATTLIDAGGYLSLAYGFDSADLNRIDPASAGILGVDANSSANIDLSATGLNAPNLLIGGIKAAVYTGTITPYASTYAFGGASAVAAPYLGTLQVGSGATATDNLLTGSRSVTVDASPSNSATFRLQVVNNNDYTGGTTVKARGLLSIGRTGGTPFGSGRVVILPDGAIGACGNNGTFYDGTAQFTNYLAYAGARFILDETLIGGATLYAGSNGGQGRWGDTVPVAINGGYLGLCSPKNNTWYETIGAVLFDQDSSLRGYNAGGTSRYLLTVDSLTRTGRGTLRVAQFDGSAAVTLGQGGFRLCCATPPAVNNGMVAPYLYDTGNKTFYTYSAASDPYGVIGLTNIVYTLSGAAVLNNPPAATDLVNQSSDLTLTTSPTVYALKTAQLAGPAYTVTVSSGGLIFSGNNKTHTANFSFGDAEGIIWADAGQQILTGTLTGTNGLTKGGASTVILNANNTATLKGPVTVNQGALQLNQAVTLGATNDLFVGYGATLNVNAQTNLLVGALGGHGTIQLNSRVLTVCGRLNPGSAGSVGTMTVAQGGTVTFAAGAAMTFDLGALSRLSDQLAVASANVNLNGAPVTINNVDGLEPGSYTLIGTSGGTMSGAPGSVTMPAGFRGSLAVTANNLVLTVARAATGTVFLFR